MSNFKPSKLHTSFDQNINNSGTLFPRRYTLTHSDFTGDLFLSIGDSYDEKSISGFYTKIMRDEVLAEWTNPEKPEFHVYCHVSGGLAFGPAKWRLSIFKQHLPMVLEAICYGDQDFLIQNPEFRKAQIIIHYNGLQKSLNFEENWGLVQDYIKN